MHIKNIIYDYRGGAQGNLQEVPSNDRGSRDLFFFIPGEDTNDLSSDDSFFDRKIPNPVPERDSLDGVSDEGKQQEFEREEET